MLSFMSLVMTGLVLLGILKQDYYLRENEVYMNSILKKIVISQLLSIMYSFIFVLVVTLSILLHKAELGLLIGPIVLVAISYLVAHKSLLNEIIYYILSILPFGVYVIVALFGVGLSGIAIVQKDDYGIGLYLIFGILVSWIMLILGSVLGNVDKL